MESLRLGSVEVAALVEGASAFGVALDATARDRFSSFCDEIALWNATMNLVSCKSAREIVERHLLDSLALAPLIGDAKHLVDLGSGAGFPGVPLAIAFDEKRVTLVEARRRRANFLREVRRRLQLTNVTVVEARAENERDTPAAAADVVVCRAVWSDERLLPIVATWLRPGGTLLWMRGRAYAPRDRRLQTAPRGSDGSWTLGAMRLQRIARYHVGRGPERSILVYRRRKS